MAATLLAGVAYLVRRTQAPSGRALLPQTLARHLSPLPYNFHLTLSSLPCPSTAHYAFQTRRISVATII